MKWCSAAIWDVESWKKHRSYFNYERKKDKLQNHNMLSPIRDLKLQGNQVS